MATTQILSSLSSKFYKKCKSEFYMVGRVGGGEGGSEPGTVCQTVSNEVKYKNATMQCRACGTINISKYVNNFFQHKTTILILSSLVSKF